VRATLTRPLLVSVLRGSMPLLARRRPLRGSIGGKSRRRRVGPHLQRRLERLATQVVELVKDSHLAVVDPGAVGASFTAAATRRNACSNR
jgi:hypothetical protein